jgi:phosphinothricin acetyltransferase
MDRLVVRPAQETDAQGIADIYNPYITGTTVTFEEEPVTAEEIQHRIQGVKSIPMPWLCAEYESSLAGYAYASRWRERSAYRFVVESTIYLAPAFIGRGIGEVLYGTLLEQLRASGIHTVIGVIALPNPASVTLHEKLDFTKVAHFNEVGYKFKQWVDVGYWQRIL